MEPIFIKNHSRKPENIKKMNLIELQDSLARQESLLKNQSLLAKLPDKGKSIKSTYEQIQKEIKLRQELVDIESSLRNLNISENEKHIQKLCDLENSHPTERYKPSSTLNKVQEIHTDRSIFKTMEDWSKCNKGTKLISLSESLNILKQQDEKVKEEQIKYKLGILTENEDTEEEGDSSSSNSDNDEGEEVN